MQKGEIEFYIHKCLNEFSKFKLRTTNKKNQSTKIKTLIEKLTIEIKQK